MSWGGAGTRWGTEGTYPVHNEDLAEFPFLLQLPGSNGHGVEEAESPAKRQSEPVNALGLLVSTLSSWLRSSPKGGLSLPSPSILDMDGSRGSLVWSDRWV